MKRAAAGTIAAFVWLSLLLQFVLHVTNPLAPNVSWAEFLIRFFGYFTIWSNIAVALTLTAAACSPSKGILTFLTKPSTQAAVAVYITMVGVVYSLFLRDAWDAQGWNAVADHALHDASPVMYVAYWLIFAPKVISWIDPVRWLGFPAVYFVYSLLRGAVTGWYPYWFADVPLLGYPTALMNAGIVLIGFAAVGFIYAVAAKLLSRTAIASPS